MRESSSAEFSGAGGATVSVTTMPPSNSPTIPEPVAPTSQRSAPAAVGTLAATASASAEIAWPGWLTP